GRIGEVDHYLRAGQGLVESLAGNRVDACVRRSRDCLVALLLELRDDLGADQAGSADDDDLHDLTSRSSARKTTTPSSCLRSWVQAASIDTLPISSRCLRCARHIDRGACTLG